MSNPVPNRVRKPFTLGRMFKTFGKKVTNVTGTIDGEYVVDKIDKKIDSAVQEGKIIINDVSEALLTNRKKIDARKYYRMRNRMNTNQITDTIAALEGVSTYARYEYLAGEDECKEVDGIPILNEDDVDYGDLLVRIEDAPKDSKYLKKETDDKTLLKDYKQDADITIKYRKHILDSKAVDDYNVKDLVYENVYVHLDMNEVYSSLLNYLRIKYMFSKRTTELFVQMRSECRIYLQRKFSLDCDTWEEYNIIRYAVNNAYLPHSAEGMMKSTITQPYNVNILAKHNKATEGKGFKQENVLQRKFGEGALFTDGAPNGLLEVASNLLTKETA
jgi:hypothetical protein